MAHGGCNSLWGDRIRGWESWEAWQHGTGGPALSDLVICGLGDNCGAEVMESPLCFVSASLDDVSGQLRPREGHQLVTLGQVTPSNLIS